eukprot:CAMPEP_0206203706 /NCGR_PEP_ID=MMETSP0166-20121206/13030_1 /ASSEMBLY_ACC=CAM_ASM_000260 /TAXON_ID=95228 /ORGANISM="Vannella robusta, Strain DIVA3 518/3/11/1/6" /LENGTH=106 /DNA_ID=CAMNT_0053623077 /DNA_START=421 /DNA_END=737 /DNA_ORIENTATION=+
MHSEGVIERVAQTAGFIADLMRILEGVIQPDAKLCVTQYLFLKRRQPIEDSQLLTLLFGQLRLELLQGSLPCEEEDAIKLGAILLQYFTGDYVEGKPVNLSEFLPA